MAAAAAPARFRLMTEAELRLWVDANPGLVNDCDGWGTSPLYAAAYYLESLPMVLWLLNEKGADVNARLNDGQTSLYGFAPSTS